MRVNVFNLTTQDITCSWSDHDQLQLVTPSLSTTEVLTSSRSFQVALSVKEQIVDPVRFKINKRSTRSWRAIPSSRWRIYCIRTDKDSFRILVLPIRNLSAFLAEMPDSLALGSLLLPGTHDTMAFYGFPISQCQSLSTPLQVQLQSGIRVLDIRLAVVKDRLIAYHGIYPERTPFQEILKTIHDFLTSPESCRETIVMSMKQEDYNVTPYRVFSQKVHDEMFGGPGGRDMWFLENRIPKLGEVRGKVVFLSRFGGDGDEWEGGLEGLGIHPTNWPDSSPDIFTWNCKETLIRGHDWYSIPSFLSIPEKVTRATAVLLPPTEDGPTLSMTFFSAARFPLSMPPVVARGFGWPNWGLGVEGVNARVGRWLLDMLTAPADKKSLFVNEIPEPRLRGWAFMDYFSDPDRALTPLLVECNYRGRRKGEEGW